MADGTVITFPPFKFVSDDLFVFALLHYFRRHFCPIDRRAVRQLVAIGMHQNLGNHNLLAWLGLEQIDVNPVAFRDAVLPATGLYDCKCHKETLLPLVSGDAFWGKAANNPTNVRCAQGKGRRRSLNRLEPDWRSQRLRSIAPT